MGEPEQGKAAREELIAETDVSPRYARRRGRAARKLLPRGCGGPGGRTAPRFTDGWRDSVGMIITLPEAFDKARGAHKLAAMKLSYALAALGALASFCNVNVALAAAPSALTEEVRRHVIVIGHNGDPYLPSVTQHGQTYAVTLDKGAFPRDAAGRKAVDDYFAAILRSAGNRKLFFFIHGGMNKADGAVVRAAELIQSRQIEDFARSRGEEVYPVFICWSSPFDKTWEENTFWVRAGKTEKYSHGRTYSVITTPLKIVADVGRSVTRWPLEIAQFAYNDTYAFAPQRFAEYRLMQEELESMTSHAKGNIRVSLPGEALNPGATNRFLQTDLRTPAQRLSSGLTYPVFLPVRAGTEPLVDSIGTGAWENMVRRTDTMFEATLRKSGDSKERRALTDEAPEGALGVFMRKVGHRHVTVVGHSMGAIIACRMVHRFDEVNYDNIVFMAAACRVSDFQDSIIPYLKSHHSTHFYSLSLHPQNEASEVFKVGSVPLDLPVRGSLLVWLDNIFNNPVAENRRMFGIFQSSIIAAHTIPAEIRSQVLLKCCERGIGDPRHPDCYPQRHGEFSRAPFWNPEFWGETRKVATAP